MTKLNRILNQMIWPWPTTIKIDFDRFASTHFQIDQWRSKQTTNSTFCPWTLETDFDRFACKKTQFDPQNTAQWKTKTKRQIS